MYEFIKEKEIEKIVLEHIVNSKMAEDRSKELIKRVFDQVISRILLQVKLYIENSNHFKSTEKVYDEVIKYQKKYEQYVENSNPEDIPSEKERDIIYGVIKAVKDAIDDFPVNNENPLEYERMLLISTSLLKIKEAMNKLQDDILHDFDLPVSIHNDFTQLITNHLLEAYSTIHIHLMELVNKAVAQLNDIKQRDELHRYRRFLEEQESMLKNFIHINLEIGDDWKEQKEANVLTATYIYPLRQLYQELHTTISDINHQIKKVYNTPELELKNIENIVESNILMDSKLKDLMELVEDDKNNTIDMIITHMNDELTKVTTQELKKLKKSSGRFELLSCIILELFEAALIKLEQMDLSTITNESNQLIATGVRDTLHLKFDILKEKDTDFHMKKKEDYLDYGEIFLKFKSEFEGNCETFLEESINGSNSGFFRAQERFQKLIDKEHEENLDKDLSYIKRDILFEISTFEDMINQSVLKLQESSEEILKNFTMEIVKLYDRIIFQLRKYEIVPIIPKSKDIFNGKLHEVVVTDSVEGFDKGQIIRMQNCGYIFENRILVRASVIAAK